MSTRTLVRLSRRARARAVLALLALLVATLAACGRPAPSAACVEAPASAPVASAGPTETYVVPSSFRVVGSPGSSTALEAPPPGQVRARHILVSYAGSRGPNRTRSKADAQALAAAIEARLRAGEDFATLAGQYGEDGTKPRGGDLGFFGRGQMVKSFEDAVYAMKVGEFRVVETEFGFHVVQRTA